jgi:hypothetical protein
MKIEAIAQTMTLLCVVDFMSYRLECLPPFIGCD